MMDGEWAAILDRYGQRVTVTRGAEQKTVKAFVQSVLDKEQQLAPSPLGLRRDERCLYLGPAHLPLFPRESVVSWAGVDYEAGTGGFFHYLGERYNEDTAAWEECYGRKLRLSLGLDIYWPETGGEKDSQQLLEKLVQVLTLECPEGLGVEQVTCGETLWEEEKRLLKREVTVKCTAWLVAQAGADGEFLDFELRGGWKI